MLFRQHSGATALREEKKKRSSLSLSQSGGDSAAILSLPCYLYFHNLTNRATLWSCRPLWSVTNAVVAVSREGGYEGWCALWSHAQPFMSRQKNQRPVSSVCVCLPSSGSQSVNARALACLSNPLPSDRSVSFIMNVKFCAKLFDIGKQFRAGWESMSWGTNKKHF